MEVKAKVGDTITWINKDIVSFDQFSGYSLSVVFMVGARGVVLGVLVLLRIHAQKLAPIAVIAFGTAASDVVLRRVVSVFLPAWSTDRLALALETTA